jgi:hypothetical protein
VSLEKRMEKAEEESFQLVEMLLGQSDDAQTAAGLLCDATWSCLLTR